MEKLFDLSEEYDSMLNKGIGLSGEGKNYFIHGRLKCIVKNLPDGLNISKILDFGCGIGDTTVLLSEYFPKAVIVGTDLSKDALFYAANRYNDLSIRFIHIDQLDCNDFDLVYVNGVFHHIKPQNRQEVLSTISNCMKPKAIFAFCENNPLNLGTKIVMYRIPFDKNAQAINPFKAINLIKKSGIANILSINYLFYFPKVLSRMRFLEKYLMRIPLGAQYCIISQKAT